MVSNLDIVIDIHVYVASAYTFGVRFSTVIGSPVAEMGRGCRGWPSPWQVENMNQNQTEFKRFWDLAQR